ncbi:MAG: hypothetical protein IIY28_01550 [Lachnospiraceae bacterium]|nr:hypothetical protein [Lachnospiraceae bacterium]
MAEDEDALFCDLAETYHVFDWNDLPPEVLARLASGLRENSRIRMKMEGMTMPLETLILAAGADAVRLLTWFNSEDGRNNTNRPESIAAALMGERREGEAVAFASPDEFEAARRRILERVQHGD